MIDPEELGRRDVLATLRDLGQDMKTWNRGDYARNGCFCGCLLSGLLGAFIWSGIKFDLLSWLIDGLFQ